MLTAAVNADGPEMIDSAAAHARDMRYVSFPLLVSTTTKLEIRSQSD